MKAILVESGIFDEIGVWKNQILANHSMKFWWFRCMCTQRKEVLCMHPSSTRVVTCTDLTEPWTLTEPSAIHESINMSRNHSWRLAELDGWPKLTVGRNWRLAKIDVWPTLMVGQNRPLAKIDRWPKSTVGWIVSGWIAVWMNYFWMNRLWDEPSGMQHNHFGSDSHEWFREGLMVPWTISVPQTKHTKQENLANI